MKKFITVVIIALLLALSLGITAFAEEEATAEPVMEELVTNEVSAPVTEEAIVEEPAEPIVIEEVVSEPESETEEVISGPESETEEVIVSDAEEVVEEEAVTNPEPDAQAEEVIEPESVEETEATEPVTEPETAEKQPVCETPQVSYSITFSNGAASFDTMGGTQVAVKDILTGLGYSVENAVITINPDTVDTSVLQITDTENGLVLTDFGPFAEANQKLVVYIDGEAVELSVVDPVEIGDKNNPSTYTEYTVDQIVAAFSATGTQDGHVKLVGNVKVKEESKCIQFSSGLHDLYLNGYTLNLTNNAIWSQGDQSGTVTFNIYGGADRQTYGEGTITGSNAYLLCASDCSTTNIYSGTITNTTPTEDTYTITADKTGIINLYGGTIDPTDTSTLAIKTFNSAKVNLVGGTVKGKIESQSDSVIRIAGGMFSVEPSSSYLLKDKDGTSCVQVAKDETVPAYIVTPINGYNCVRILSVGTMTGHKSLSGAVDADGTVVMLTDINESVNIGKNITLNLNGHVLDATNSNNALVVISDTTLNIIDGNSENIQTGTYASLPKGGNITGAAVSGIDIHSSGAVINMYGGTIFKNGTSTSACGGVDIYSGTFNMYGGCISSNNGSHSNQSGGGVYVRSGDSTSHRIFNMYGGSITGNTASCNMLNNPHGGGVLNCDIFNMYGGEITGNKGKTSGGVYNGGTMTVGGTAKISGNTLTDGTTVRNLYLPSAKTVTIGTGTCEDKNNVPVPESGMSIGVTTYVKPADNSPVQITTNGDGSDVQYFSSDENYAVHFSAGHLELVNHRHGEWKYSANGDVLTATCCTAGCTLTDNKISITVSANGKSYDGKVYSGASIDNKAFWEAVKLPVPDIVYYAKGQTTQLAGAPTAAGVYIATITVGSAEAKCEFIISQRSLTVKGTADGKTYDGTTAAVAHIETVEGIVDTDKGDVTVEIDTAVFIDKDVGNGKDVTISYRVTGTKSGNYTVSGSETTLANIEKRSITLTSGSGAKVYDGASLTKDEVKDTLTGSDEKGFVTGEGAAYTVTGSQTLAGSSKNAFTYTLNSGTKADNYTITTAEGTLTVNKISKEIVITAASDTKLYDGKALENSGYTYTADVLVSGDILTATVAGTITNAGTVSNVIASHKVMRGDKEVTGCYTFGTFANGTLTVNKCAVTLTSGSATKVYDGTPVVNNEVAVSGDGFASGEGAVYTVIGSQKEVGSSSNIFTYELNSSTKPGNYSITKVEGVLTITEKPAPSPTPSPAPSPVPAPKQEKSIVVPVKDGDTVLVEAKIVNNKAIVSYFSPETIRNILAGKNATGTVTIDCSNIGPAITEVEIKTADIKTVAESAANNLRVGMSSGFMSLNKEALVTVTDEAKSDAVVLVIEEISNTKLNTKQKNAVNAETVSKNSTVIAVVDSYILSNTSKIKDLGNGKAALEINSENFSSGNAEIVKTENIIVYEISEDGTMKTIEFEIIDGMIVFDVNRLSRYIVTTA